MEGIINLRVYYDSETISNTHKAVTFVCECLLSFAIPCTMSFVDFKIMPIIDNEKLYVKFEQHFGLDAVDVEVNVDEFGDIYWEEDNNDSEEEFEANYKFEDENNDGDLAGNLTVQNEADAIVSQHPFNVPSFMRTLDLEAMHPGIS
ncbi:hypothetical protein Ahy_A10g049414 isoform A [Arachis hypogaea]|uniref:Transposase MuDR plant domain-containing protein n=1 Tax=Arachis hypogaea TaxID=3818 RepID=A0A445B735_ARAHY|nr:hypothetical protein Ahy_A10g049414 isoform A [Arachis hypogaea]